MKRHLLVTVSEHKSAMNGVRFLGDFFSNKEGLQLTLFYTVPRPAAVYESEKTLENIAEMEFQARGYEDKGRRALEEAASLLHRMGFEEEQVQTKLRSRRFTKVKDIVQEGAAGFYDAVVLGRRGLSWLEEAFDESVSKGLMDLKVDFPIWFCRHPSKWKKGVLVCVDHSEASCRMADHVGYILTGERKHPVTLLYVNRNGAASPKEIRAVLSKAKAEFERNGFPNDLVESEVVESNNIAKAILKEASTGKYATVATGRTGEHRGLLKKAFMGSVSFRLFRDLQDSALWISQ